MRALRWRRFGCKQSGQMPFFVCPPQSQTHVLVEKYCEIVLFLATRFSPKNGPIVATRNLPAFCIDGPSATLNDCRYSDFRGRSANLNKYQKISSENCLWCCLWKECICIFTTDWHQLRSTASSDSTAEWWLWWCNKMHWFSGPRRQGSRVDCAPDE